jgi:hypothetical protein
VGKVCWPHSIRRLKSKIKKQGSKKKTVGALSKPEQQVIDTVGQMQLQKNQDELEWLDSKFDKLNEKLKDERRKSSEASKNKNKDINPVVGFACTMLMTVRNVSATYSVNDGTSLPGYNQSTSLLV